MKSKATKGSGRKRRMAHLRFMPISATSRIRRLTEREIQSFRVAIQRVIDRGVKA